MALEPVKTYDLTPFEFDEEVDLKKYPVWFLDGTHSVPPWTPAMGWVWINYCRHGMQWAAEELQLPTCRGWDWRLKDGGGYLTVLVVDDEEQIRKREAVFRQRLVPFIEDYDKVWQDFLDEIMPQYDRLKSFKPEGASNAALLEHLEDALRVNKRMWEIHFYMMYVVFGVFILFEAACKEMLGIDDSHPQFHRLVRGFDNKVFQVDRTLWQFSRQAAEMGLTEAFMNSRPEGIRGRLEASEVGRKWLAEFKDFLEEDGWRANRMSELNAPTWVEDMAPALGAVKQFMTKGGDFDLDRHRQTLAADRAEAECDVLAKIPPAQREWFKVLMSLAQKSSSFSEEHNHYLDLLSHALVRRALVFWGDRLVKAGTIEASDDVFFITPDEIRKCGLTPEFHDYRPLVARRRAQWLEWQGKENPPVISRVSMDEAMGLLIKSKDPIVLKVVVGTFPVPRPELKADLYGTSGSPGVVEGVARVVMNDDDLAGVKEGEILVAPSTYPSWTPVFALLKGVVVDRGASLSHAAIVGREYGIPVVMNVFEGTKKITSGQRVRVDGNLGTVYILDAAGSATA